MSESEVSPVPAMPVSVGGFIPGGRRVAAGQGWQWIASAFTLFKKQPAVWILILLVLIALAVVSALIFWAFPGVGSFVRIILFECLMGGIMIGCRALEADAESFEVGHVFAGFDKHTANLIVLGILASIGFCALFILFFLIVGTGGIGALVQLSQGDPSGVLTFGFSLLLGSLVTLALSIPLYMALWFAPALIVLNDFTPTAALKASFSACWKNFIPFLVYGIVMTIFGVVAAIPFFLGYLVLAPLTIASIYTAYRDIYFSSDNT